MLEVINASKTFAKGTPNEHKALDHLNLSLKEGEFVTILGSNGAGKSTLFNAICGNFLLDEGSVILDGKNISYLPEHQRSASIGRLFQNVLGTFKKFHASRGDFKAFGCAYDEP